eukprot:3438058-Pleurochrysis_carterae.AAC.3
MRNATAVPPLRYGTVASSSDRSGATPSSLACLPCPPTRTSTRPAGRSGNAFANLIRTQDSDIMAAAASADRGHSRANASDASLKREIDSLKSYRDTLHDAMKGLLAKSEDRPHDETELTRCMADVQAYLARMAAAQPAAASTANSTHDTGQGAEMDRLMKELHQAQKHVAELHDALSAEKKLVSSAENRAAAAEQALEATCEKNRKAARSIAGWEKDHQRKVAQAEQTIATLMRESMGMQSEADALEQALTRVAIDAAQSLARAEASLTLAVQAAEHGVADAVSAAVAKAVAEVEALSQSKLLVATEEARVARTEAEATAIRNAEARAQDQQIICKLREVRNSEEDTVC